MVSATDSYPLLAIPFFVLAGAIMNKAGITAPPAGPGRRAGRPPDRRAGADVHGARDPARRPDRLVERRRRHARRRCSARRWCKANYSPAFAAVITSCAAIITALIPPSIGLIIYGYIADVSVGRLFIGGIVPGLLLAASLMIVTWIIAKQARLHAAAHRVRRHAPSSAAPSATRCGRSRSRSSSSSASATASSRRPRPARSPSLYTILVGVFAYREPAARRPAEGDEGDGARHQLGDADDLRRLRLRLLPRLGADPAADGGLAGVADRATRCCCCC